MIARIARFGVASWLALGAASAQEFSLSSPDLKPWARLADEQSYDQLGCQGANLSPQLTWSGAPEGTKSFTLMLYDPDAPTEGGFWHWAVFDIPATTTSLVKGAGDVTRDSTPPGAQQALNDFGSLGYGGPCPPAGDAPHRYHFVVFALAAERTEDAATTPLAALVAKLRSRALASAELVGVYGR